MRRPLVHAAPGGSATVRLLPAPPLEPPFDDELDPDTWLLPPEVGAQLLIEWRDRRPAPPPPAPADPVAPPAGASAEAWHAAQRFLERCVEIFNGFRPTGHARVMSSPAQAQTIVEELAAIARRTSYRLPPAQPRTRLTAVVRRRLRVSEPRPGAAEATAVLAQGDRIWAVAFRLERGRHAWLCTAFVDIGPQPGAAGPGPRR